MLFATFKKTIATLAAATPNTVIPLLANKFSRGRLAMGDAAEIYLALRFVFAVLLASLLDKSMALVYVVGFIQVTSLIYLLKIVFPLEGPGLTDPNRSLFFALGHYFEIGLSMAYVYWVLNGFGIEGGLTRVQSLYFSFVTMTTIGFGDFSPKTEPLQLLVVAHGLVGIFMLATVIGLFLSMAASEKSSLR